MSRRLLLATQLVILTLSLASASAAEHSLVPGKVADWRRFEVGDIEVITNASVDRAVEDIRSLQALRSLMGSLLIEGTEEHLPPLTFVLFDEREHFVRYQPWYEGKRVELAGWFVPAIDRNTMVVDVSQRKYARPVLLHEYVHAWMAANLPNLPLWMNEGFAEFYSTFRIEDDQWVVGDPIEHHLESLTRNMPIGLPRLTDLGQDAPEYNEGRRTSMLYAQSWSLVHFFMTTRERRAGLTSFIEAVHRGTHHAKALETSFGVPYEVIEREMLALKERPKWPVFRLKGEARIEVKDVTVEQLQTTDVLIALGEVLAKLGPSEPGLAQAHFDAALELDPKSARALRGIAVRQRVEGRTSDALATLERVLELAPDDPDAHLEMGLLLVSQWENTNLRADAALSDGPPEALAEARQHFEHPLAARPQHALATAGLAMTYLGEVDPVAGVEAMERARRTLTWEPYFLTLEIVLRSRARDTERARELLDGDLRQRSASERARGMIDFAESVVVNYESYRAEALAEAGDFDAAMAIVDRALEATSSRPIAAHLSGLQGHLQRESARTSARDDAAVKRTLYVLTEYERAKELAAAGERTRALTILRALLTVSGVDPQRRAAIEQAIRELE